MTPDALAWAKTKLSIMTTIVERDPRGTSRFVQTSRWEKEIYEAALSDVALREALDACRALLSVERHDDGRIASIGHESDGLRRMVEILDAALSFPPAGDGVGRSRDFPSIEFRSGLKPGYAASLVGESTPSKE